MNIKKMIKYSTLAISGLAFILFTLTWWQRFNMPYNEEGRYFDGIVVWHEQAITVYALLSALFFSVTTITGYSIWKKCNTDN